MIYYTDNIYGIRFIQNGKIIFIKKYDNVINTEIKKEIYEYYENIENKDNVRIQMYIECGSTNIEETFCIWDNLSSYTFLDKFTSIN
jgi:hypothetical protein